MLQICPQCGAVNPEHATTCSFCELPLDQNVEEPEAVASPSSEPEWRLEVARRLEAYRTRRGRPLPRDPQEPFPFIKEMDSADPERASGEEAPRPALRSPKKDRVEIAAYQPELNFAATLDDRPHPESDLVPVAGLGRRFCAGLLDTFFLALTFAGFLALFSGLGGHFVFQRVDEAVYGAAFLLLYTVYFALFTTFGGPTPGMQLCDLTVVSFDGNLPSLRQLLWRSFGYVVAGGAVLLGFLWSLWDEDHLTWQDRISQTYIAPALQLVRADPAARSPEAPPQKS